jgi:chaperonin GroES
MKPLGNRILIEITEAADVSTGGIFIPETAQEKSQRGVVLAIGDGNEDGVAISRMIDIGDSVLFAKYTGTELKLDNKKAILLKYADLLAVL